ncbi:MAG: ABC transporter permease [Bacteroidetes bacterium]|nr:ABC transporter permease [Bacteroidota bacterium]
MKKYKQLYAMLAISKASFRSITRSPSAVVFTLLFPLIFILVFGFLGGNSLNLDLGIHSTSEKNNPVYRQLKAIQGIQLMEANSDNELYTELEKGRIDAVITIKTNPDSAGPLYFLDMQTSAASMDKGSVLKSVLENLINQLNLKDMQPSGLVAELRPSQVKGRKYSMIDFILPGQLGFSILSTGVFGTAFVFFNLRQTLVIKRFFATPIQKPFILMGEALSRLVFAMLGAIFIISIGYFAFGFTLVHGLLTALFMLLLAAMGLLVFMGFGFIISGLAKNESMIPPLANLITLPQFLLSGTFFPIESFPSWLQPLCKILPLTYLNDALRKVAFEGAGLYDISFHLLVIILWGIAAYALAVKFFRWE